MSAARVSVLIPARNEQENLAACVESIARQPEAFEVIVADDASEDRTAAIARQLARTWPNVRVLSVPPLPDGWIGKNHALHAAVREARGEWFLFTDADTRHAPHSIAVALERARREGLDLLSFSPEQEVRTWWEKAVIPIIFKELGRLYPFARVNEPTSELAAANGQFILIRRDAYQRVGGHEASKSEVLEDVDLARRVRAAGGKICFDSGAGVIRARMYRRFAEMWQGWTKNLFLLYGRNSGKMFRAAAVLSLRYWLPFCGALVLIGFGARPRWLVAALLAFIVCEHVLYFCSVSPPRASKAALLVPGSLLVCLLLLNSERRYSRNLGVDWKGRHYGSGAAPDK